MLVRYKINFDLYKKVLVAKANKEIEKKIKEYQKKIQR